MTDKVCAMEVPDPAVAPDVPDSVTVHAKVAPAGTEVRAIPVAVPEQIVCAAGVAVATGVGFTVIGMASGKPTQSPIFGVTV